jgi:LysM repeat protein
VLIYVLQGAYVILRALVFALRNIFFLPLLGIARKLFGSLTLKAYGQYVILKSKLAARNGRRLKGLLKTNAAMHAVIIIVSVTTLIFNIMLNSKQTFAADEAGPKPALFYLIQSESADDQELVTETFSASPTVTPEEQSYLQNLGSVRVQQQVEMRPPDESVPTGSDNLVQGGTSVVQQNLATTNKVKRQRETIIYHTVASGETVSTIAQEYEISVATILWENDLNAYSVIRPGQKLAILPTSGVSYAISRGDTLASIAQKYSVAAGDIADFNKIADSSVLRAGQKIIIPGGQKRYTAPVQTSYSGLAALKNIVIPPSVAAASGNKMNWPTEGHRITQYYSWSHHAVDIANKIGTPIYAADAGTVIYAGWGTGYGNEIVIDHGGGKQTRYAHASRLFVDKGDTVKKGQTIAAMGSTGNSTGPHLHFEVIINNVKYNPLDYVK